MKLYKVLLFVLSLILIIGIAQAKINNDGAVIISKTSIAPVVDGKMDPIWNAVDATWMEYVASGKVYDWSDIAGWAKLLYDDSKIYGIYYVQDNVVDTISSIDWQMDGIEFYIDVNNTHAASSQLMPPKYQLNLRPCQPIDSVENAFKKGLDYKWLLDTASINAGGPSGYFVEFSLLLDSLGLAAPWPVGKKVSVQLQLDDNDNDGNGRIHVMNWHYSPSNQDYLQTLDWGDAVLGDEIDTKFVFLKTSTAPVIDGTLDAIWNEANQATLNFVQPQSIAIPSDEDWRFYGLYDDNNIYGFYTVYDNAVDTTSSIDWQMDGVEFFCDANNTHIASAQLMPPKYQFCLRPCQPIDSVINAIGKGIDYKWSLLSNIPNDSVFSSRSGWQLEFKLSLDSLGFTTPASSGKTFSFQLQTDDNDNDGNGRIHTANWWYSPLNQDYLQTLDWGDAVLGSSITTGVDNTASSIVQNYKLLQNYPNPFNPSTEISFTLPKSERVKLTVYNLLGKEIAVLVNGMRSAGIQTVTFDAKNLSSGVYFYRLETGSTMLANKMILLK